MHHHHREPPTDAEFAIAEVLGRCHDDPDLFNTAILGRGRYWWRQSEICRSIVAHKTTVAETGNSVGKSYLAAGVVLWWLFTRPGSLVITTAPSQTLLGTVLFKELRRAHANSLVPLGGRITVSAAASPQTLQLPDGGSVLGIATKGVERLSGHHDRDLLALVDEASGILAPIWEALFSLKAKKLVVLGNPLQAAGPFVDLARRGESERDDPAIPVHRRCVTINVPTTDSPDILLEESTRGLADAGMLAESLRQYGETSLWYRTHIKAIRPTVSHDQLIPAEWLDACCGIPRHKVARLVDAGVKRIGCDLGEGVGRDKTVIPVRDDLGLLEMTASDAMGLPGAAAEVARLQIKWGVEEDHITYDALGIGRDLLHLLVKLGITQAQAYKGSYSGGLDFFNLRAACGWAFRMRLDPTREGFVPFAIPHDEHWPQLRRELLALRYELARKVIKLEPKEDMAARLGHSPDYADALLQTFARKD